MFPNIVKCLFSKRISSALQNVAVLTIFKRSVMHVVGRNVIITGGSTGIGWEIVKILALNQACNIAILDINQCSTELEELATKCPQSKIVFCKTDVSRKDEVKSNMGKVLSIMNSRLDILINCAGQMNDQKPDRTVQINLLGTIYGTLNAMAYMSKLDGGQGGLIVNVASGLQPLGSLPVYTSTSHGIIGWTRSMADEFLFSQTGVGHMVMLPGPTKTALIEHLENKVIFPRFPNIATITAKVFGKHLQTDAACAINFVKAMEMNKNGSAWILDNGKMEEVKFSKFGLL